MNLSELKSKIKDFETKAGFDKTDMNKLLEMIQKEIDILKNNTSDKSVVDHQLADLQVLIMQIANRYNTDFDSELKKWFEKSKKYVKE